MVTEVDLWDLGSIRHSRVIAFIDGNNLYHSLKECKWPTKVDIGALAARLAEPRGELKHVYYYNAPPPSGLPYSDSGNRYLAAIARTPNLTFRKARLQATRRPDEHGGTYRTYVEKGADTAMSADMVLAAAREEYDVGIIVSSDGDFEPTVRLLKGCFGKEFEVIYFPLSMPFVMRGVAQMRPICRSHIKELTPVTRPVRVARSRWFLRDGQ